MREETQKAKSTASKPVAKKLSRIHKPEDMSLEQWQIELRRQFGREQNFLMENMGEHPVFSEFTVTNPGTGGVYRVSIRGDRVGSNYCTCPDFAINTLGTCKHIEFALAKLEQNQHNLKLLQKGYLPTFSEVYLHYGAQRRVLFLPGAEAPVELKSLAAKYFDSYGFLTEDSFSRFDLFLEEAKQFEHELRCYDDVLSFIAQKRDAERRRLAINENYLNNGGKERLDSLLKVQPYPYQREGALFAARAGRVLIADDMGLGKTIQAIAATQIMAKEFGVESVLIVCPTSLKYQWKYEIEKFCDRSAVVIEGLSHVRQKLYLSDAFFKIINYEMVPRDLEAIKNLSPDLVILDEAQRIKNWKTRTAQSTKRIQSEYAIVLTGTPLENRLEELHSIVEFVDRFKLGPLFRFLANHQVSDPDTGRAVGYRNLKSIGETLTSILLRRAKSEVLQQLPDRTDKNFFVPMTKEQWAHHDENQDIVARVVARWKKNKFLSESDQRRLMIALQNMRMACDNTYLLDQKTCFGPKLDELMTILGEIFERPEAKVVVFSQWQRMNDLVAQSLKKENLGFVYLHGGVPGHKRKDLISAFREDAATRLFLSTDAGGVGLNLQTASTVINLDLPWNPAVLEQRIGRVHRIGQHEPVMVFNFVAEGTIEHGMLQVLSFKKSLLAGALDGGEDSVFMGKTRLNKFMESVQSVTEDIPKTAQEPPPATRVEAEKETEEEKEREVTTVAVSREETIMSQGDTSEEREAIKEEREEAREEAREEKREREQQLPVPAAAASFAPLLEAGAALLKELGTMLTQQQNQGKSSTSSPMSSIYEKDEKTGQSYLKIPMPDQKVVEGIVAAIGPLLDRFRAR